MDKKANRFKLPPASSLSVQLTVAACGDFAFASKRPMV